VIESSASQRYPAYLVYGTGVSQADYNYQEGLAKLSTIENGLAVMNTVEVKEGDPVVDASGSPTDADGNLLTLTPGMKVKNADGEEVEYTSGTVMMNQLVVTYKWVDGLTWSDGTPVTAADFDLGFKIDCDHNSGNVSYLTCDSMQSYELPSDTEQVVTYKPGYVAPLYFIPWENGYPAHQVVEDGRTLADVPVTEWSGLKEIAETPMGYGPYILTEWEKGVKMEFEENPHYVKGPLSIKHITELFITDTQQAVAQLLTGDVDVIGSETLGAGAEVQTVLDAQAEGKPIQVLVEPSATWEHIDFNMYVP
jgi:ABC-type transport system substrate-binding protein